MKKRQKKKNQKKYVPIHADEFNLMTMTEEERKKAWDDYLKYREKHGYFKKYRDLKEFKKNNKHKLLFYQFPMGENMANFIQEVADKGRRKPVSTVSVTQSLLDIEKATIKGYNIN